MVKCDLPSPHGSTGPISHPRAGDGGGPRQGRRRQEGQERQEEEVGDAETANDGRLPEQLVNARRTSRERGCGPKFSLTLS